MVKKLFFISLIWGVLIFILSSIPGDSLPAQPKIPHFDKIVHAGLYFLLASFIMPVIDSSGKWFFHKFSFLIVLFISALYGGFIEIAQEHWFINRSGDIKDFISDLAGCILGIAFYYLITKRILKIPGP